MKPAGYDLTLLERELCHHHQHTLRQGNFHDEDIPLAVGPDEEVDLGVLSQNIYAIGWVDSRKSQEAVWAISSFAWATMGNSVR